MLTSNKGFEAWGGILGDEVMNERRLHERDGLASGNGRSDVRSRVCFTNSNNPSYINGLVASKCRKRPITGAECAAPT